MRHIQHLWKELHLYFASLSGMRLFIILAVTTVIILLLAASIISICSNSLKSIINNSREISVNKFLRMRNRKGKKNRLLSNKVDGPGIYIIHNHSQRMYYVGQAQHMVSRANNHFTGKGNGRVYADYDHGDRFTIRFVPLKKSRFKNLNDLERYYIKKYDALEMGYNRTKGNK